jgi:hypothetical protein
MKKTEILEKLCVHDKRNPDYNDEWEGAAPKPCHCDNCFYGRHKLALYILALLGESN